ncbi:hypothetical protein [Amnibacterium kyonggiense]|uniref:Uncharacterized protein n=1 Tax=Amnibacterium kyonggiense TaxID=595671 RepID=A0A4R7FPC5_9MICO|nr:hypothetical protein [Amnibacterium kyonggiense]TDS79506.1 hypothetical protein CLV52_0035 [Amnibacterium kyonggiense]
MSAPVTRSSPTHIHLLAVERHGSSATIRILRGPDDSVETYSIDLDREIEIGLADTLAIAIAIARAYGLGNGSLI